MRSILITEHAALLETLAETGPSGLDPPLGGDGIGSVQERVPRRALDADAAYGGVL